MRTFLVCAVLTLFSFSFVSLAQDFGGESNMHRNVGDGSHYTFQDSQGRRWTYAANAQGGYDVLNSDFEKVAYVVATYE